MKKSLLKNFSRTLLVLACCLVSTNAWATSMWILGDPAGGWAPNNGVQMNQSSDNQFWKILYMENGWNFSFTSSLAPDWASMANGRLCPFDNDFPINDGNYTCSGYGQNTNNSFDMNGESGYYTITINSTDRRMEIHPTSIAVAGATNSTQSGQPDVVFGTSWNALDNVMTANGQNYTWTSSQVAALNKGDNVEFKVVANGNTWIGSNGNNGNNITCTAPIAGNYVLNVTYTVDGVPQGTLTEVSPATEIATLNDLVSSGVSGNKYTITEKLLAVYKSADNKTVWFKDNDNATDKDMPEGNYNTYEVDLGNNDIWYSAPEYFDQSNWIEVVFPEAVNYGGEYLKNLTGIYTNNNGNPMLTLTTTWGEDGFGSYTPNRYTPANFAGSQQGYFFVKPKAQEYAQIIYAKIQGNKMVMADNNNNITGEFTIDWSMNGGYEPTEGVFTGFNGIIRNAAISPAPRLMSVGGNAVVSPTNLTSKNVVTAISTVGVNGEVKSVKYVNIAGMVSDRPFQGVNIVVTEYTDGTRTTAKVVK